MMNNGLPKAGISDNHVGYNPKNKHIRNAYTSQNWNKIRNADISYNWSDICNAYMNELCEIPNENVNDTGG